MSNDGKCPDCGQEVLEYDVYCQTCGRRLLSFWQVLKQEFERLFYVLREFGG